MWYWYELYAIGIMICVIMSHIKLRILGWDNDSDHA